MQTYVFLCKFTAEGIKGVREGAQRRQAAREGKVAILEGVQASQPGRERRQGGKEGFGEFTDIESVASQPGEWRKDKGQSATENILTAYPDLGGIFASNDQMLSARCRPSPRRASPTRSRSLATTPSTRLCGPSRAARCLRLAAKGEMLPLAASPSHSVSTPHLRARRLPTTDGSAARRACPRSGARRIG